MNDEDKARSDKLWKFVEETAKRAEQMPAWMKGGTSEREQCDPKTQRTHVATSGARKK
jgi:hypothetical protein